MTAVYSAWLLVVEPKHMLLEWSSSCEGYRGPKLSKRDFVSNSWRRRRNRCDRPMEEASVNNTNDSLDERYGKKIKNTIKRNNLM